MKGLKNRAMCGSKEKAIKEQLLIQSKYILGIVIKY